MTSFQKRLAEVTTGHTRSTGVMFTHWFITQITFTPQNWHPCTTHSSALITFSWTACMQRQIRNIITITNRIIIIIINSDNKTIRCSIKKILKYECLFLLRVVLRVRMCAREDVCTWFVRMGVVITLHWDCNNNNHRQRYDYCCCY